MMTPPRSRPFLKASGIANLTDARYFAAREVDFLGFRVDGLSPDALSVAAVKAIREWIEGPRLIAEVGLSEAAQAQEIANMTGLNGIQQNAFAPTPLLKTHTEVAIFQEIVIDTLHETENLAMHLHANAPVVDWFLLDYTRNGFAFADLSAAYRQHLQTWCAAYPVFLALPHHPSELADLLAALQPYGISLSGSAEEKVGFKSFDELDDWFAEWEQLTA